MSTRMLYVLSAVFIVAAFASRSAEAESVAPLKNQWLTVSVRPDGSFELRAAGLHDPVFIARVGAQVNEKWIWSSDYPQHRTASSTFHTALGAGHQIDVSFAGSGTQPSLKYTLQLYEERPYGNVQVRVENTTDKAITVQNIRALDVVGDPQVNLGGPESAERVLSDSYSEDRPVMHIFDLGKAPTYKGQDDLGDTAANLHLAVGSQLIYNQASKFSLLLAALSSDRWLTIMHLHTTEGSSGEPRISAYSVDSTGTTEIVKKESLRGDPPSGQIPLSLLVAAGKATSSETLAFSVSQDYHSQLEDYGEAIRLLHHPRIPAAAPWGWWSWTAYYFGLSQGTAISNAQWLSQHLKDSGFNYFHIDAGYAYDDGEYATPNATLFPDGLRQFGHQLCQLGLTFGMWTAPFRVAEKSWVYKHHPEWLVHDAQDKPIQIGFIESSRDAIYVLDATHPGAQDYLRQTYRTLTREWGARYFKFDFMDDTAIEGYHYRPNVTALQAQRIGLQTIREAVGNDVLLDKDGSAMLNTVGLTELGRISADTGHSFQGTKEDASGIAARYYMNNNFYISDPDAFTVSEQLISEEESHQGLKPLTLDEAEVSITLAAVAGGMFEIGDDLPTLGSEPDRMALLRNRDLLNMVQLRRAATPLDLMTFSKDDGQPSIFLSHEDKRQSMLAVFNWTENPRSHEFTIADLGIKSTAPITASDVFHQDRPVNLNQGILRIDDQAPHSVRLIKIIDNSLPVTMPAISMQGPKQASLGATVHFSAAVAPESAPVLAYYWDFGDGVSAQGPTVDHAYTQNGTYKIVLKVDGLDGSSTTQTGSIEVKGSIKTTYDVEHARRYKEQ